MPWNAGLLHLRVLETENEDAEPQCGGLPRPKRRRLEQELVPTVTLPRHLPHGFQAALPRPCTPGSKWKHRRREVEPPEKPCKQAVEVSEFYGFMWRREALRRRRELRGLPPEEWTKDRLMARIRLTNVKREDDRTTRVMRKLCNNYVNEHPELRLLRKTPASSWDSSLRRSARSLVFNFALWRAFGTDAFAQSIGFLTMPHWNKEQQGQVVRAAMERWHRGHFNYTDAYDPSRSNRFEEVSARSVGGACLVHRLYSRTCASLVGLWAACDDIVEMAVSTSSWRSVTRCIMKVSGYGGTGFLAKELVQDLLHTPLFETWSSRQSRWVAKCHDLNSWCAVGPGARRGLNRLHGRRVNWNAYCDDERIASQFLRELRDVFDEREKYWHGALEGSAVFELELHDVQFQLCELDKYEREKKKPGHVREYKPPADWRAAGAGSDTEDEVQEPRLLALRPPLGATQASTMLHTTGRDAEVSEDSPEEAHEERIKSAFDNLFANHPFPEAAKASTATGCGHSSCRESPP